MNGEASLPTCNDFDLIVHYLIISESLQPAQPSVFPFPPIPRVLFSLHPPFMFRSPFSETYECGAYQHQRSGRCCQGFFFLEAAHKVVGT